MSRYFEGVEKVSDLRMTKFYKSSHFCYRRSLQLVVGLDRFQYLGGELVVPVIDAAINDAERALANWAFDGVSSTCQS